jgi:hypothetical protein
MGFVATGDGFAAIQETAQSSITDFWSLDAGEVFRTSNNRNRMRRIRK